MSVLQIAIDGPVGAGKSEISTRLAKTLGITYLNTGAMYRAVALMCHMEKVGFKDTERVLPLLKRYRISIMPDPEGFRGFRLYLNKNDVTEQLFIPDIDKGASDVSTIPEVRKYLVGMQKRLAKGNNIIMEGRDIGYRVLPGAGLKDYLTASIEERARRRYELQKLKGGTKTPAEIIRETVDRDRQDMNRVSDPLMIMSDAWELDTTGMTQEEVVNSIRSELKKRKLI